VFAPNVKRTQQNNGMTRDTVQMNALKLQATNHHNQPRFIAEARGSQGTKAAANSEEFGRFGIQHHG
jgi:hypothetical protein